MRTRKKITSLVLTICLLISMLLTNTMNVHASDIYSMFYLKANKNAFTLYTNQPDSSFYVSVGWSITSKYSTKAYDNAREKISNDLVWTTSDASVVQFVTYTHYDADGNVTYDTVKKLDKNSSTAYSSPNLIGLSEGTATLTLKSKVLNKTLKFKVTVKNAELKADHAVFYTGNSYTFAMKGNVAATSFSSSNEKVATIHPTTGLMKAKKAGTTTISCVGDDGKTYKYKVTVEKCGLSYTKLTTYYYTGFREGAYTCFPLVAKGINVKSWKSSNSKVCKVNNYGSIGQLQMMGTGKCTITCTAKNGKTYKCNLTVVGGKPWGGLSGGYRPTLSELKKHGYFKDINRINDYGNVIVTIVEDMHEFSLGNGNKRIDYEDVYATDQILNERYPGAQVQILSGVGDYLIFTNDPKNKTGRITVTCYYVK